MKRMFTFQIFTTSTLQVSVNMVISKSQYQYFQEQIFFAVLKSQAIYGMLNLWFLISTVLYDTNDISI